MNNNADAAQWLRGIALEVEENPSRWTQGELAKNSKGMPTTPSFNDAVCWCAEGFMRRDDVYISAKFDKVVWRTNDALSSPTEFVQWFRAVAEVLENCDENA